MSLSLALGAALLLPLVPAAGRPARAAPDWPPSTDILVGEVVTGGASGSDEYVELFNRSDLAVQLDGLELVYVTASGGTVTTKQRWTDRRLRPGEHRLIANADGIYAGLADDTYTNGLSATGGSVVLRVVGGAIIDTLSWGSAASTFVEGTPGPAPRAGWSLERLPGGLVGNGRDTNDNAADTVLNELPIPEGSRQAPEPTPEPTPWPTDPPTPEPTARITPVPTPVPTPEPTARPSDPPTPEPTARITPEPTPQPTPAPTATPRPTATPSATATPGPTPVPTATPRPTTTPSATATPGPTPPASQAIGDVRGLAPGSRATVTGVVTAEPGRILGDHSLSIQDGSGGIVVRLAEGTSVEGISRGRIMQVSGVLAAPYGNLEIRPTTAADALLLGSGGLPAPQMLRTRGIDEASEGLLATLTATVVLVERRTGSAFSLTVRDDLGVAQVYVHDELGTDAATIARGERLALTGIVGQRASRTGAADGHRLWPRDGADIEHLSGGPPRATPRPDPDPGPPGDEPPGDGPRRTRIGDAVEGEEATIVGTVTSRAGLIDTEGRRVTVEDPSGAILVRYPEGSAAPGVGAVIRARGEVGTWYGGRQLEAEDVPRRLREGRAMPTILRRPPEESDEWQLVAVTVRLLEVERDGEAWRAEATLGTAGELPLVGLASAGISSDGLDPGRSARVVGIVKRAHPSASDQRFAVVPRTTEDVVLGRLTAGEEPEGPGGEPGGPDGDSSGAAAQHVAAATTATLDALHGLADALVRVGGRLVRIEGARLTLDDGTAEGTVRLVEGPQALEPPLRVGEVLNVVGRVRERVPGQPEIVVRTSGDVSRAGLTAPASPTPGPGTERALLSAVLPGLPAPDGPAPAVAHGAWPPVWLVAAAMAGSSVALLATAGILLARPAALPRWRRPGRPGPTGRTGQGVESPEVVRVDHSRSGHLFMTRSADGRTS
jgi:DNA/RNA endonuclease YhcR with UshA esterase domain